MNYSTWGFGANFSQFYVSSRDAGGFFNLKWIRAYGGPFQAGYVLQNSIYSQGYINNSIYYVSLNPILNTSGITFYSTQYANFPNYFNHYQYQNCPAMTVDAYLDKIIINCKSYVQIRNSYQNYAVIDKFNLTSMID